MEEQLVSEMCRNVHGNTEFVGGFLMLRSVLYGHKIDVVVCAAHISDLCFI